MTEERPPGSGRGDGPASSRPPSLSVAIPSVGTVPLASMVERIIGAVIDALILLVPTLLLVAVVPNVLDSLAGIALSAGYVIFFLGYKGATIGGRIMNIKCVAADTGGLPGTERASRRWLLLFGPGVIPVVGSLVVLVIGISPLFDDGRRMQGWHDKWAGTYVVKTGPNSPIQQEASLI